MRLDDRTQTGQPRPRPDVGDGRRTERAQGTARRAVSTDAAGAERPAQARPRRWCWWPDRVRPQQPARRDLDERQQEPGGVGQGVRVAVRPALARARSAELGRASTVRASSASRAAARDRVDVRAGEGLRERRAAEGAHQARRGCARISEARASVAVTRCSVPRRKPIRTAVAASQRRRQLLRVEALDAAPQPDIRVDAAPAPAARRGTRRRRARDGMSAPAGPGARAGSG